MGSPPPLLLLALLFCNSCCIFLASFSIASTVDYSPSDLQSESRLRALFDHWNLKHGKHYPPSLSREKDRRFEIFRRNLHHIHSHNQRPSSYRLGLTRFADLTIEEFKASRFLGLRLNASSLIQQREAPQESCSSHLTSSFDWREQGMVLPIKDQGSCGSCWAFATISAVESVNAIRGGNLVSLSEQELVSCDGSNYGCDGGDMDLAMEWIVNHGIDTEADYPYTSSHGVTGSCEDSLVNSKVVVIDGYMDVNSYDEDALLCAVAQQPVVVAINAGAYDFQLYAEGVFNGQCSGEPDDLDHAVVIVGWGSTGGLDYWIVRNSWGMDWGAEGYAYMVRNTGNREGICGINSEPSYPIKMSVNPTPDDVSAGPMPSPQPGGEPPPPPPAVSPPPPPPSTPPPAPEEKCDLLFTCPAYQTCCCTLELFDICLIWGCCDYQSAVCCSDNESCCPLDYPICDLKHQLCLQNDGPGAAANGIPIQRRSKAKLVNPVRFDDHVLPRVAA